MPPDDASYKDKQFYKRECIELEKRLAFNRGKMGATKCPMDQSWRQ